MEQLVVFIGNHWALWLALVVILVALIALELQSKLGNMHLSAQQVVAMINHEEALVLDLRDKKAFADGHIIGAKNITAAELTTERLAKLQSNSTQPLVLSCASGQESVKRAQFLQKQGVSNIKTLTGGVAAWRQANLPLTKEI